MNHRERLLRRVHALKDRQRQGRGAPPTPSTLRNIDPSLQIPMFTPTPSRNGMHHYRESSVPQTPVGRQLDFSNIPETPMTTPTLPPVFYSSRYKHLTKDSGFSLSKPLVNNERRKLEPPRVNIVPPSTPAPEASPPSMRFRERSVTVSPTRSISSSIPSVMSTPSGGVKNKVLNYVGSFFNRQQTPKTARYAVSGPSALPRPSEEDIGAIYPRGPVYASTPFYSSTCSAERSRQSTTPGTTSKQTARFQEAQNSETTHRSTARSCTSRHSASCQEESEHGERQGYRQGL